ncbi:MAG: alanine--glyoxylate aminotransferase family protein [Lysobacterales bacterium]
MSFHPPERLLLGPGPSDVPERVLQALARPTIGHLDPAFVAMMDQTKTLLRRAFRTENRLTIPVSAPGSAGMEACFVNLIEPGDTVIVCQNGVFGGRMKENVLRVGATPVMVQDEWGRAVDPDKVRAAIAAHPEAVALAFVHAETSTGARSDARTLCQLAQSAGLLTIVDAVTSLGGIPLEVDAWGIDAIYSGSQKCLSAPPGISPLSFSERAVARLQARKTPVQSWFLDLSLVMNYWEGEGARSYHHTAPVNALYGVHEALLMLDEEGLEAAWARHQAQHERLREGLSALGLDLLVPEAERLPQLNAVRVPEGVDEALVRRRLLTEKGIEIGAGLGALAGKIWRIGLMGHSAQPQKVDRVLAALADVLH